MNYKLILLFAILSTISTLSLAQPFSAVDSLMKNVGEVQTIALGDLDNDGDIDIVQSSERKFHISWFENNGDTLFIDHAIEGTEKLSPTSIEIADIDDDGDNDIIVTSTGNPRVVLLENRGGNSFKYHPLDTRNRAHGLSITDFNNDGLKDIAYGTNNLNGSVNILYNKGDLSFQLDTLIADVNSYLQVYSGDMDNDGHEEILYWSGFIGKLGVIKYIGEGQYVDTMYNRVLPDLSDLSIVDLNDDGFLDIVPSTSFDTYTLLINDQNGGFEAQEYPFMGHRSAYATDLDTDGDVDIVLIRNSDDIFWFNNQSDGTFTIDTVGKVESKGNFIKGGDLNGDGMEDLVTIDDYTKLKIYLNTGSIDYTPYTIGSFTIMFQPNKVYSADLDNNGMDEIIGFSNYDGYAMSFVIGPGGVYTGFQFISLPNFELFHGFTDMAFLDANDDGLTDIIASSNLENESLTLYVNKGGYEFDVIPIENDLGALDGLDVADINADGEFDIVCTSTEGDSIIYMINNGDLDFTVEILSTEYTNLKEIHFADIDLDNDLDVVCFHRTNGNQFVIFENTGNGTLTDNTPLNQGVNGKTLLDLDQDGDLDILGSYNNSQGIHCHYNDGEGYFSEEEVLIDDLPVFHANVFITAADLNNDGHKDLITLDGRSGPSSIIYAVNNGDGSFQQSTSLPGDLYGAEVKHLVAIDMDFDGDKDIAIAAKHFSFRFLWAENLAINCAVQGQDQILSACKSYTTPNGETITNSATFTDTIYKGFGCDSIKYFDVNITNIDTSVLRSDNTLEVVDPNNVQISWVDCDDNYAAVPGETSAVFEVTSSGNYAVIISREGCVDTSACFYVQPTSVKSGDRNDRIQVYPNPATDQLSVMGVTGTAQIMITDISGKTLLETSSTQPQFNISLEGLNQGLYFLRVKENNERERVRPFVKE